MHERHEKGEKERIKKTYQEIEAWVRSKSWREERYWWKMSVWVEREERGIGMFESEQNRVKPKLYIEKCSSIDREGIKN